MQIPKATIEAIRERTDIVQVVGRRVTLKRRGASFLGLCPFHQEKTPSFNVLPSRQIYHCFGCGTGGDVFRFVMESEGVSFVEAVKELAEQVGVSIRERELAPEELRRLRQRATLHDVCKEAETWFHQQLLTRAEGEPARAYLARRSVTAETIERCRLGFAPPGWTALLDHLQGQGFTPEQAILAGVARRSERTARSYDVFRNRVVFPIEDDRGRPIAFGGRLIEGDGPKYINSPETGIYSKSSTLYGLARARPAIQRAGRVIVVEGYFDAISLVQAGFGETVATCGTALTPAHLARIRPLARTAFALFDADEAGLRAAVHALPLFLDAGVEARHLELPGAKDPDEFIRTAGPDAFRRQLDRATPLLELALRRAVRRHGSSPGGRQQAVEEVVPLLRGLPGILQDDMLRRACNLLGVGEAALREAVGRPVSAPARSTAGTRYSGSKELAHLLWLLLHHAAAVAPALEHTDPAIVSSDPEVHRCIARLLEGDPLPEILRDLDDPDLARLLTATAARTDLYTSEQAPRAVRQVLATMEKRVLRREIGRLRSELEERRDEGGQQALIALVGRIQALQKRLASLRNHPGAPPPAKRST